jgi:hypothetical protein
MDSKHHSLAHVVEQRCIKYSRNKQFYVLHIVIDYTNDCIAQILA